MKCRAIMTTALTTTVLMVTGITFADELTHTIIESRKHVATTLGDPVESPSSIQEKSQLQTEQRSSTMKDPYDSSTVQERSHIRTEQHSSSVNVDPVPPPPSAQERSSSSYKTEERSYSTSDPLNSQERTSTRSSVEERSATTAPPPDIQQRTTIERRSSTVKSD